MNSDHRLEFGTEDLLRKAILGLLARMEVSGIQLLHGTTERGKDIVFRTTGPFGVHTNWACVIKNTDITGGLDGDSSARVTWFQIEQALDTSFVDGSGNSASVQSVLVITPNKITPHALQSIQHKLSSQSGRVNFIGGEELVRLFQKHWPSYFADEATTLARYFDLMHKDMRSQHEIEDLFRYSTLETSNDIPSLHYVKTSFHLPLFRPALPDTDSPFRMDTQLNHPLTRGGVEAVCGRLLYVKQFILHACEHTYISPADVARTAASVDAFCDSVRSAWNNAPKSKDTANYDSSDTDPTAAIHETRLIGGFENLARAANGLRHMVNKKLAPLADDLSLIDSIQRTRRFIDIGFPHNGTLSRLLRGTDCINAFYGISFVTPKVPFNDIKIQYEELRAYRGLVAVVAPAGFGKTSFCRWSALEDLRKWRADDAEHLPIYIRLSCLGLRHLSSETELLGAGLHAALLTAEEQDAAQANHRMIRLYLDGLDEAPTDEERKTIVFLAKSMAERHDAWQIIITSRDYFRAPWIAGLPRIELTGFQKSHVADLSMAILGDGNRSSEAFMAQLEREQALLELARVPLLATLMILVYRSTGDLPSRRVALYRTFVDLLCGGWDLVKGVKRPVRYGREVKVAVLSRLASIVHKARLRAFPVDVMSKVCLEAAPGVFAAHRRPEGETLVGEFVDELVVDGLLSRGGNTMEFAHLSFQEYLVATEMCHGTGLITVDRTLSDYLNGDDWWQEALFLFVASSNDPEMTAEWIERKCNAHQVATGVDIRRQRRELLIELQRAFPSFVATR